MSSVEQQGQWVPKPVPDAVQRAREELARRLLANPSIHLMGVLEAERIVVSSTWRMKSGGSFECAVCGKRCGRGRRDLCPDHDDYRFVWYHHAGGPSEYLGCAVKQVHSIAGLTIPDNPVEHITEEDVPNPITPSRYVSWSVYHRRWHMGYGKGLIPCSKCGDDSQFLVADAASKGGFEDPVWYCETCAAAIPGRWTGE